MNIYSVHSFSNAGRKGTNQDAVLYKEIDENTIVIAIADGVGGQKGGSIASKTAVNTVFNEIINGNFCLNSVFIKVQRNIEKFSIENEEFSKLGTTLTVALIKGQEVEVGHVGDTRLYHLRGKGLISVTKDQTELQKLLDEGIITKQRARFYHRKNILLSALTPNRDFEFQHSKFILEFKDKILLLTDGAYSLITKIELRDLALMNEGIIAFVNQVEEVIEGRDINDDYSLIGLEYNKK